MHDRRADARSIAIIGAGLRLPGQIRDLAGFWQALSEGRDLVGPAPTDRGDPALRPGAYLDDITRFDAAFFGIAPREAEEMDPAQRLLLDAAHDALEHGAQSIRRLDRSATGVYVGLGLSDYGRRHFLGSDPSRLTPWSGTGAMLSVAAGRISYALGLQGPAMTVDTACSSSLVAVHLAVQALRDGTVDLALAGGANVVLSSIPTAYFEELGALAADGRCKTFSADADGYGRGEGAAIVALKRLREAVRDGDPILGVIHGTAINQDGRSNGLTAPSGHAQQAVIRQALADAGIEPGDVGYVEAHGTGTPLGDPIEIDALRAVFGERETPLPVGSVKTNLGHLETAAGVTGLLKLLLALEHRTVPRHLHADALNPRLGLPDGSLAVPTAGAAWPDARFGGVSAFGLSGTNAHVVVGRSPEAAVREPLAAGGAVVLPLSAPDEARLLATARSWAERLADPSARLVDAAATAQHSRTGHHTRLVVVGSAKEAVREALLAEPGTDDGPMLGRAEADAEPIFLFTGQGAQWPGMGRRLYGSDPTFREALDAVCALVDPWLPEPLRPVMFDPTGTAPLDDTAFTQPALFALQIALVDWLAAHGVVPGGVIGHSVGEITAATVAGIWSREEAARIVTARGALMSALPGGGAMAAVFLPAAVVVQRIEDLEITGVDLAALNGPAETVVSGERASVLELSRALEADGVRVRELTVSHAFHSHRMDPMLTEFEGILRRSNWRETPATSVDAWSTLDGRPMDERWREPAYWRQTVRAPVCFGPALQSALDDDWRLFVELGPRPVLTGMATRSGTPDDARFVSTLHPDRDGVEAVQRALGALWVAGIDVDWGDNPGRRAAFPPTARTPVRHWRDAPATSAPASHAGFVWEPVWRVVPSTPSDTGPIAVLGDSDLASALTRAGAEVVAPELAEQLLVVADSDVETTLARVRAALDLPGRIHWLTDERRLPVTALLQGFARTLTAEHPERAGSVFDGPTDPEALLGELGGSAPAMVRFDGHGTEVVRRELGFRPAAAAWSGEPLDPEAIPAVWITGGLGAVGLTLARWLAARGTARIILTSRGVGAPDRERMAALQATGATIEVKPADITDTDAVAAIVADLPDGAVVFHLAGLVGDGPLATFDPAAAVPRLAPKVEGARIVADALRERGLRLVLFGSASTAIPNPGQGVYAAGNAFLRAFAARRRADGQPVTAIGLGPLEKLGMAAVDPAIEARWAALGVDPLPADDAFAVLLRIAAGPVPDPIVVAGDGRALAPPRIVEARPVVDGRADWVRSLGDLPADAQLRQVEDAVRRHVNAVLGADAAAPLDRTTGFVDRGLDSLMAVQLTRRLASDLGGEVPPTWAFDHPTLELLAEAVLDRVTPEIPTEVDDEALPESPEPERLGPPDDRAIAIVGAGLRLPGGIDSLEQLWEALIEGRDLVGRPPEWRRSELGAEQPAGWLEDLDQFDPLHFGISPREAETLDPQQRVLLEVAWAALEDAAIAPRGLRDGPVGTYVGIGQSDYGVRFSPERDEPWAGTGNESSFASGRIAHALGLRGPALAVNTACSSSLVAVHLAAQALRAGHVDVALAGGVHAMPGPRSTRWIEGLSALSPEGRCRPFDHRADGYVRAEGCAVVVLKRLRDAIADGDPIRGVIRGSAINHDGASAGLTVPSARAQQDVLRRALDDADLEPGAIGFVQCHGTGTKLGDPIEVGALGAVLAADRPVDAPLHLRSIKANLGHSESAAGVVGLLEAMLVVERGTVPPQLHFERPNPALGLERFPAITIPRDARPWRDEARRAGVSAFGLSGTNAHVVVERAPPIEAAATPAPPVLLAWSGRTGETVTATAARLLDHGGTLPDVARTLAEGRSGLQHRAAVVTSDASALAAPGSWIEGEAADDPGVVFLCTGAGPQRAAMGHGLYRRFPVFREALDEAASHAELDRPLLDVIFGDDPALHDLAYTQPAMFALQVATARLWASLGVVPTAVIGHSTGQFVAAHLAGMVDLGDGMRWLVRRARLMSAQPREGAMAALLAPIDAVQSWLAPGTWIAALNGPSEVVVSGPRDVVEATARSAEAAGFEVRRLAISHAAHSALVDPILADFEALTADVPLQLPRIPIVDNVTGDFETTRLLEPVHWRRHLREPVRFADGMRTLVEAGHHTFLELGNHPVLAAAGARIFPDRADLTFVGSQRRDHDDVETFLEAAGRLWTRGVPVDLGPLAPEGSRRIALPPTPLARQRYWVDAPLETEAPPLPAWGYRSELVPFRPPVPGRADGPVWIVADGTDLGERLAAQLGARATLVEDPAALPASLVEADGAATVVVLSRIAGDDPVAAVRGPLATAIATLSATVRHGNVPTLWVTRGALTDDDHLDAVLAASLVGVGHVAALELGRPPLARVDVPIGDEMAALPALALLVAGGCPEGQYAVRDGALHRQELVPFTVEHTGPSLRGTAWITGGLGALGQHTAHALLEAGAEAVVLTGRTAREVDATALREAFPGQVHVRACDVADRAAVDALLAGLAEDQIPPVRVVVHAAGVLADRALATWTPDDIEPVFHGKVRGAVNLDAALPDLDAFVLYSSAASLTGRAGQATYAAANAVLDRLAAARRARGQAAVAIQWGPWAEEGLASSVSWQDEGIAPLRPEVARRFVLPALAAEVSSFGVLDVDWASFGPEGRALPALLAGRVPASRVQTASRALRDRLDAMPAVDRREALVQALTETAARILRASPDAIGRRTGFFDLGFDSLMAVELAQQLRRDLDPEISLTVAFDHPSIERLAEALAPVEEPVEPEPPSAPSPVREREPIAIVGVACRMPGSANDPEAFWRLLVEARDPVGPVPAARWDHEALYDPRPATPGKTYAREAGFVDDDVVESFDHGFFGIPAREAASLDPQQRMLLEVSWEALERARVATDDLAGSPTGVFVGVGDSGYLQRFAAPGEPLYRDAWSGTGSLGAFVSGRIAYALGLHGPNLALNTACSSSLVAIHLAVQALDNRECTLAVAGGVHLMLHPEHFVYVSQLTALSPDGRCHTFDAEASGYGRAEGCAMFVLAPLSVAEARDLPVLAVIRGSAVGHDGASAGLTVPNGPAQEQVLRAALDRAHLAPSEVDYIETHGTGTRLGDPIEVGAIAQVYGGNRTADAPLRLGAVKSNVGHLEVAAGAASLLKVVLAMQHRTLPPNLHLETPNPALRLEERHFVVPTTAVPWEGEAPRRAGISSFGLAGTNAHIVVEEAPSRPSVREGRAPGAVVWPLSAATPSALRSLARAHLEALEAEPTAWADLATSAAITRRSLRERAAFVAVDPVSARTGLEAVIGDAPSPRRGPAAAGVPLRGSAEGDDDLVWLFTGQGSQYPGMGRGLYEQDPRFRDVVDRGIALADPHLPGSLGDAWFAEPGDPRIHDTTYTQPALFVLQVALAERWRAHGVMPRAVAGHSIGQVAAAWAAGVLSFEDGVRLCAARGRLLGGLPAGGGMLAVFAPEGKVAPLLAGHPSVGVAAVNHADEVVLSGPTSALELLAAELTARAIESRPLTVSHAFHSALVEPILDEFEAIAASVSWHPPELPLLCNRDGGFVSTEDVTSPRYWRELVRAPVRFADNLATLADHHRFLEIGPHRQLTGLARRQRDGTFVASLSRDHDDGPSLAAAHAALWTSGLAIDWAATSEGLDVQRRALPTYPFERVRCWLDAPEFPDPEPRDVPDRPGPETSDRWYVPTFVESPLTSDPAALRTWIAAGSWVVHGDGPAAEALRSALNDRGAVIVENLDAADAVVWVAGASDLEAIALLPLVQDLAGRAEPPPLFVLTTGAVAAGRAVTTPGASALYGLLRTIALEAPHVRTVAVDRAPDALIPEAWLAAWADAREPEHAFTGQRRFVRRLRPAPSPRPAPTPPASALITGGLRGIGLALAQRWAGAGTRRLVLVGRSTPSDEARAAIGAMTALGCAVDVVRADLAQPESVDAIRSVLGPRGVDTVVHAAGALADRALAAHDAESFAVAFGPKVAGTRHIFAAIDDPGPTRLVLLGAGASLLGSPGQANYAAANAWLSGFAHLARAKGWPAVVVDWGPWAETGMAARLGEAHAARQAAQGIRPLALDEGLGALERLGSSSPAHLAYFDVDWSTLVSTLFDGRVPSVLDALVPRDVPERRPAPVAATPGQTVPIEEPLAPVAEALDDTVARIAASLLGRDAVDRRRPLAEQGLDSLLAVQLKNELLDLGHDVPIGRLVSGPSVERIAELASSSAPPPVAAETTALVPAPRRRRGPHPLITHGLAFVVGVLFVVVGYAIGLEVFGPRIGLPDAVDERSGALPSDDFGPQSFASGSRSRRGTQP